MPAARRRRELGVSLFPFLSVLACVIGTLTLLIAALAVGQVASDLLSDSEQARLRHDARAQRLEIAALERAVAEVESALEQLEALRAERRTLELARARPGARGREAPDDEARRLEREIAELERRRAEQREAARGLSAQVDYAGSAAGAPRITIEPAGAGPLLKPFFVECTEQGLEIHKPGEDWSIFLPLDEVQAGTRFQSFLQRVRAIRDGTVIFLIRPRGVLAYDRAVVEARKSLVRHAKLPLPGDGELDFSRF